MRRRICASEAAKLGTGTVLGKYVVQYFACGRCGFIQTESPFWLAEAYSEAIARTDIGLVGRNLKLSTVTRLVILSFFNAGGRFIDYGGGTGMFVRIMRDHGFDFYWTDKHASNQFAAGFEGEGLESVEAATSFEVFEHLVEPLDEISVMLSRTRNLLFSTMLVPRTRPLPEEWWYYALQTGQHVSLYTRGALLEMARRFGLNLYSNGVSIHLLTERRLSGASFSILSIPSLARLLVPFFSLGRRSLLEHDYFQLTGKRLR